MHALRCASMVIFTAVLFMSGPARAQNASSQAPPRPCDRPECRQFDFWIGDWDVTDAAGKPAGHNTIRSLLDGCVLEENWTSASSPFAGHSFNIYDAATGRWHQTWVDNTGNLLRLDGGFVNGKMVLVGTRPPAKEGAMDILHRITWEKKSDDEVRQLWEASRDGGQTWKVLFDGTYRRTKK